MILPLHVIFLGCKSALKTEIYNFIFRETQISVQLFIASEITGANGEVNYLGVVFISDGRHDKELDMWMGKARAIMQALQYSVITNENCWKTHSSQFSKQFFSILTYDHESYLWYWPKEYDCKCKRPKWDFCEKSNELCYLTKCIDKYENLTTSSHYFSESKDYSLDGLAM